MRSFSQFINEDAVVNAAGAGGVAGIGVGPQGEPGIKKSQMIRRRPKSDLAKIFMGMPKKVLKSVVSEGRAKKVWGPTTFGMTASEKIKHDQEQKEKREEENYNSTTPGERLSTRGLPINGRPRQAIPKANKNFQESALDAPQVEAPEVVRSKFAGSEVFQVPSEYFHKARMGKAKYAHYHHYVGKDAVGQTIRAFGNRHYGKPIIIQDDATQHMLYLRYGKGK